MSTSIENLAEQNSSKAELKLPQKKSSKEHRNKIETIESYVYLRETQCQVQSENQQPKTNKSKNDDKDSEVLPMFGAMFIASCLGGPTAILAGMKLGMFAAVGGGIMGYTTGKMFAESGLVSRT